jgi:hypothetical protein
VRTVAPLAVVALKPPTSVLRELALDDPSITARVSEAPSTLRGLSIASRRALGESPPVAPSAGCVSWTASTLSPRDARVVAFKNL